MCEGLSDFWVTSRSNRRGTGYLGNRLRQCKFFTVATVAKSRAGRRSSWFIPWPLLVIALWAEVTQRHEVEGTNEWNEVPQEIWFAGTMWRFQGAFGRSAALLGGEGTHWVTLGLFLGRHAHCVSAPIRPGVKCYLRESYLGDQQHRLDQTFRRTRGTLLQLFDSSGRTTVIAKCRICIFPLFLKWHCLPLEKITRASSNSGVASTSSKFQWFGLKTWNWKCIDTNLLFMIGSVMAVTWSGNMNLLLTHPPLSSGSLSLHMGRVLRETAELSFIVGHTDIKPVHLNQMELEFIKKVRLV